jgi:hypothetical protein
MYFKKMIILNDFISVKKSGETLGHGQGLVYNGEEFYYAAEREIPRDRVVSLVRGGNDSSKYKRNQEDNGRRWIIVVYDKDSDGFLFLEHVILDLMHRMMVYKGQLVEDVISSYKQLNLKE